MVGMSGVAGVSGMVGRSGVSGVSGVVGMSGVAGVSDIVGTVGMTVFPDFPSANSFSPPVSPDGTVKFYSPIFL